MISENNEKIIRNKLKDKKTHKTDTYELDQSLLMQPVAQLIEKIRMEDIALFLKVSQLNFLVKDPKKEKVKNGCRQKTIFLKKRNYSDESNTHRRGPSFNTQTGPYFYPPNLPQNGSNFPSHFNVNYCDSENFEFATNSFHSYAQSTKLQEERPLEEWISLVMFEYEIDEIILGKRKRPDEELKHSFKAVRKGVERYYRLGKGVDKHTERARMKEIQEEFHKEVLENKKGYIQVFRQPNVTKEVVSNLKNCGPFARKMNEYIEEHFLREEIESNVLNKKEEIMSKRLSLEDFLLALMTKQKKNGWIVQHVLNSLGMLENCCEETIMKRKGQINQNRGDNFIEEFPKKKKQSKKAQKVHKKKRKKVGSK